MFFVLVHFTQLIWSQSKYLGVGLAQNENMRFVVCNYDPRGNIVSLKDYAKFIPPVGSVLNIYKIIIILCIKFIYNYIYLLLINLYLSMVFYR